MKLISAHVTNFRSILDSEKVDFGQTTCLVGKNEAGKTAFLKALEGFNPLDKSYKYSKTRDYPRRNLSKYDNLHDDKEAKVIVTTWRMSNSEKFQLDTELGEGAFIGNEFEVTKKYGSPDTTWNIKVDESIVLKKLAHQFELDENELKFLDEVVSTEDAKTKLESLEELSENQKKLKDHINSYRKDRATLKAIDLLDAHIPEFMYFSHYDRMNGELSINQLRIDQKAGSVDAGDHVFLDFLNYAGTDLDELEAATEFEELNAKCEAAANAITDEIFEYWTQNDQLEIQVNVDSGKADDPAPFNEGTITRARVRNNLHRVSVPFSERSAGFIWFFSFLVKFAQLQKHKGNVIILLDEPGLTLHGTAQKDLLRYFDEKLAPKHQLIFSTHSPFMVPADNLDCVRTVEDVVSSDSRGRPKSLGTKVRSNVLATDPQTNFPIFGAMGYELTQGLVIAPDTLLVEGPSDILYLQAMSKRLQTLERKHLDPKWAVCPAGGIDKILPFVSLFRGNQLNMVVLTDFDRSQKNKLDKLYKTQILEQDRIILATEIAEQDEADIEDLFHPKLYADLLNKAYSLPTEHKLTEKKLLEADKKTERLVKKAEAYFRLLPDTIPMFNHFDPSAYLLANPKLLEVSSKEVTETLNRFENAFNRIDSASIN